LPRLRASWGGSSHTIGSRVAELLPLEHLAMRCLADVGVPASRTRLLVSDAFFGKRDSLPEFAARRPPR
jgi:hypothetical protein